MTLDSSFNCVWCLSVGVQDKPFTHGKIYVTHHLIEYLSENFLVKKILKIITSNKISKQI